MWSHVAIFEPGKHFKIHINPNCASVFHGSFIREGIAISWPKKNPKGTFGVFFTNTAQELKTTQCIELRIITWVFKPIGLIDADHVYNVRIPSRSTSF